jgi:hypothetical protein
VEHSDNVNSLLVELEQVLAQEHEALLALDRAGIERAGERKLELVSAILATSTATPS